MKHPPPRSTLFPYTTLFRSQRTDAGKRVFNVIRSDLRAREQPHKGTQQVFPRAKIDRKSTRLNSSHANRSYAVFCLKKKINHNRFIYTDVYWLQIKHLSYSY